MAATLISKTQALRKARRLCGRIHAATILSLAGLLVAAISSAAIGATIVWSGGAGGNANNWNNKQPWVGKKQPGAGDTAQFDNTADASNLAPSIGGTNTSVGAITFTSGTTNAYDVSGTAALTVATAAGITNSSATNQQFSVSTLALGANQTWSVADAGNLAFSSDVSLDTRSLTLAGSGAGLGSIDGIISGTGGLLKTGTGTWALAGASTFTGTTTISQGTLIASGASALGASAGTVTVDSGATLALDGGTTITKSATLSLDGTGTSGSMGALHAGGGTGTTGQWSGNISLADNATITAADNLLIVGEGSTFSNTLSLGANTLTLHTPSAPVVTPTYEPFPAYTLDDSNIVINAKITGTGGVTKTGSGTASIIAGASGGNTFTGDTVVTGGTLILDGYNSTPAINSDNIFVGNAGANPGTADSIALQLGQLVNASGPQNAIGTWNAGTNASTSNMTVYSDGVFKMNNASTGFANLTLQGGHVDQGAISSNPLLTLTGTVTTNASSRTALIDNGNLAMSANNFTFTIASGTTASGVDLQIDSILQTGGGYTGGSSGTSLVKAGTGTLALTNLNNYAGITNVSAGVLNIRHDSALGQTGSFAGDTANGTVVQSGAQLQLEGGITIGSFESLILNGTGVSTSGAMRNVGGSNSYLGLVTLGSASTITANSGTSLTLSGGIATSGNTLTAGTVANNGNITISGSVSGGGNLIKNGANTLTLSGSTTTLGTVTMNAGTLNFNGTTATTGAMHLLGGATSVGGSTTLNTGAIDAVAGTTLTIASGGSVVADYASGTTTFSGALAGGGGFEKTGAGTLVFDNPFTASSLTLTLNGGTLSLLGGAFSVGTIHITGDTILDFNNSAGTFFSSTSLVIEAGVTVTVNNWISVANNSALSTIWYATSTINGGSLGGSDIKGGTPLSQIEFSNFDGLTTTWVSSDHDGWFDREIRPTPEPATYGAMFLGGCLGLLGWRRWRARHPACGRV